MAIHVFGLTGGIGSGKSTVAARFRERGLPVVDADELARAVVEPGSDALAEIAAAFGAEMLTPAGELDRKKLAARVFGDEPARLRLNAITHPRVRDLSVERFGEFAARGEPLGCYEVPLLVESKLHDILRPLVVVVVDEATQVARTMARDGATEAEARARIAAQLPLAEKAKLADYVIDNGGTLAETREQSDDVLDAICRDASVDPARFPRR